MPAVNVNIQPEIIRWALSQTQKEKLGDTLMNNIIQWLNGTSTYASFPMEVTVGGATVFVTDIERYEKL